MNAKIAYQHSYENGKCAHCGAEEVQTQVKLGDVNGDGNVNSRDARMLLLHLADMAEPGRVDLIAADYNQDGNVNSRDARMLLRARAGLE